MSTQGDTNEQLLRDLERQVADLKRLVTNLTESATLSRDRELSWVYAMEGNRDGVWDWNAVTNEVFFSKRWKEMLGFGEDEISNHLSEWDKRIHPDDRDAVYADLNAHLKGETPYYENEHRLQCKDGSYKWILDRGKILSWTEDGKPLRVVGTHSDVTLRREAELENQRLVNELREAFANLRVLRGLIPICASCKKIRDDRGYWNQLESFIRNHSEAEFSHSICPDCARKVYLDLERNDGEAE
jgi:PAS domain S-box-containing protein